MFLSLIIQKLNAQNLIPNPSFEDFEYCPNLFRPIDFSEEWYNPISSSPDYLNTCSTYEWASLPYNNFGYQQPRTGDACAGIIPLMASTLPYYPYFYSEYLAVKLNSPLQIGQAYEFEMFLNLADSSRYATSSIGVLFTTSPYVQQAHMQMAIVANPQLINAPEEIYQDTLNWESFRQTFISDSAYKYVIIGSFQNPEYAVLVSTGLDPHPQHYHYPYYFIDDVSLKPVDAIIDTICFGQSISLISQTNLFSGWANSLNPDEILSMDSIWTVSPTINTTFYEYHGGGTINHMVYVAKNLDVYLGMDTILCYWDTLILHAPSSYSNITWDDGTTHSEYYITETGTYWVDVENVCGVFSDTIYVSTEEIPIDLGGDTLLCAGETVTLNPGVSDVNYLWNNGITAPTYKVHSWNIPGTVYVEVRDSLRCGRDTITIDYHGDFEGDFIPDIATAFCEGGSVEYTFSHPNAENYLWSNGSTDSTIVLSSEGQYWLELSNRCFSERDSIIVLSKPTPFFDLGEDLILCNNETLVLEINTIPDSKVWWDTPLTSSPITIQNEGEYIAIADYKGCIFKDSIYVAFEDCEISLTIPNIFTPNADGMNDLFSLYGENINSINIRILNRWGQLVFESNDINNSWNGKTQSEKDCPTGTYFYTIVARNKQRSKVFNGTITLLK